MKRHHGLLMLRLLEGYVEQGDHGVLLIKHPAPGEPASILYANPAFERLSGYRSEEIRGRSPLRLLLRHHLDRHTFSAIRGAAKMFSPITIEVKTYRRNGTPLTLDLSLSPVFNEQGQCTHWGVCLHDITGRHRIVQDAERRRMQAEMQGRLRAEALERERVQQTLRYLAFHDVLTGLPNRSLLLQQVASQLLERQSGAMLCVHLEGFGAIVRAIGPKPTDALLTQVSNRLRSTVRPDVALARLETGTFAAWVPHAWEPAAVHDIVESMLESFGEPFHVDSERVALRAHIGIAPAPPAAYTTPEELLRDAEIAAHAAAKANARYRRFSPPLHEHSLTRMRVEFELHRAIARRQFVCHFQPVVHLAKNRVVGFEALVRWHDPERGLVPPHVFVPIAEETGHIVRIGELVLEMACGEAMRWPRVDGHDLVVNVNVSPRQCDDEHFVEKVRRALRVSGLPPHRLCLEMTETAFAHDEQAMLQSIQALRELGVCVALDDFGIGYSSLASLRRLPFVSVKIDRSFISAPSDDEDAGIADESIVLMIVALAKARGLYVTAEGIETARQLQTARALGCTHAQGYFIARPMPADRVEEWLQGGPGSATLHH
jgi:PAS domain S-box-containing protein/diguanylate cyclase (GGDEF)-like protein